MAVKIRIALISGATLWCLAIVAAPVLQSAPIYLFFSQICHQLSSRSWHIHDAPLAVCIRCTSIYFGFLTGLIGLSKPRPRWLVAAGVLTLGQWLLSVTLIDIEWLRAVTGALLGASAAPIVARGVTELFIDISQRRAGTVHGSM